VQSAKEGSRPSLKLPTQAFSQPIHAAVIVLMGIPSIKDATNALQRASRCLYIRLLGSFAATLLAAHLPDPRLKPFALPNYA
jgi:hypothetical protein